MRVLPLTQNTLADHTPVPTVLAPWQPTGQEELSTLSDEASPCDLGTHGQLGCFFLH